MLRLILFIALYFTVFVGYAQNTSKISLQINYGLNGNFFVRDYDELGGPNGKAYFFKKNFIGTVAGINLNYQLGKKSSLFIEYSKSINDGRKNYAGNINGADIFINDFKLRHTNNIYQLGYGHQIGNKKTTFQLDIGAMLIFDAKQTIEIEDFSSTVRIDETNFKNANSVEGGIFFGGGFRKKIDTKFHAGFKFRVYYLVSTATLEAISLTPTLTYSF